MLRNKVKYFWFLPKEFVYLLLVGIGIFAVDRILK